MLSSDAKVMRDVGLPSYAMLSPFVGSQNIVASGPDAQSRHSCIAVLIIHHVFGFVL